MSAAATHIIRLQRIEVVLNGSEADGFALQNRLSALCRDWLPQAIEHALERYAPADGHLVLEYLEVDLGALPLERLEQAFPELVRSAVETALREKWTAMPGTDAAPAGVESADFKSEAQATWEAFLHFLETGRLPWAYRLPAGGSLGEKVLQVLADRPDTRRLFVDLKTKIALGSVRSRLVRQFSPAFLNELAERVVPVMAADVRQALAALHPHIPHGAFAFVERVVWEKGLEQLAGVDLPVVRSGRPVVAGISESVLRILAQSLHEMERQQPGITTRLRADARQGPAESWVKTVLKEASVSDAKTPVQTAPDSALPLEGLVLDYAGLVLLHPFLPQFFRALGVADDATLTQPDRALHLLHFLASGKTAAPEHELTFAKILCGIPLGQPVEAQIELTDNEQAEAINLLQTVVRYWDALRDTSPEGLREAFLRRPGKLVVSGEGGWQLFLETRTHDILLQQLPWGIGMIQLPWMPALLRVEWD
jgi:hypothetical protein